MIGNDIIDLELAEKESNWKRKGYLEKLFSDSEQEFIFSANNQSQMVWVLWSIKESVYKAYLRMDYQRGFYPLKIEIKSLDGNDNEYHAEITLNHQNFMATSRVTTHFVDTVAVHHDLDRSKVVSLKPDTLYYKDSNGLPLDYSNNPISISHHGNYKKMIRYT